MLQDSILYVPQSNFDLEIELCDSLFREYDEKFKGELNFSFDDFLYLSKYLNENFNPNSINILSIDNPEDTKTWVYYSERNFVDSLWEKFVFSIRSKGLPTIVTADMEPWIRTIDGKKVGTLNVRVKK